MNTAQGLASQTDDINTRMHTDCDTCTVCVYSIKKIFSLS